MAEQPQKEGKMVLIDSWNFAVTMFFTPKITFKPSVSDAIFSNEKTIWALSFEKCFSYVSKRLKKSFLCRSFQNSLGFYVLFCKEKDAFSFVAIKERTVQFLAFPEKPRYVKSKNIAVNTNKLYSSHQRSFEFIADSTMTQNVIDVTQGFLKYTQIQFFGYFFYRRTAITSPWFCCLMAEVEECADTETQLQKWWGFWALYKTTCSFSFSNFLWVFSRVSLTLARYEPFYYIWFMDP